VYNIRIAYNMFEDMIIKYSWSAVGLIIASIPVFFPEYAGGRTKREEKAIALLESQNAASQNSETPAIDRKTGSRTQGFITNKKYVFYNFILIFFWVLIF
jgi:ATP-binding cassette, subfamily D (ALD), peroxisomal long-chain fatty acid import protein